MHAKIKRKKASLFDIVNTLLVIIITLIVTYPLYFCIIASFSDPTEVALGNTLFAIKGFTVEAYKYVFETESIWIGYRNTILYTLLGTSYNLILTIPAAYVLTKKYMPLHNVLSWYFFITMYISGGMIPNYILRQNLDLIDNPLVLIIGTGVSCYNLIVTRQYFSTSIHPDIYEAASIDGASEWRCFLNIALPLAKPILAVMALYYGVGHWNSYYNALIYIRSSDYWPLQLVLRSLLIQANLSISDFEAGMDADMLEYLVKLEEMTRVMKYAIIFISCLPLLIIYPFLQKYFAKGIMIGSVKG